MKVRLRTSISGTRNGQPWPAKDEVVDLPADEAAELLNAGNAEAVVDEPPVEKATLADPPAPHARKK